MVSIDCFKISIIERIKNFFCNSLDDEVILNINIPKNVVLRTKLLCSYIEGEQGIEFNLNNFLMLIYLDFIKNSIESYCPEKIFKMLTKDYYSQNKIVISNGSESCVVQKTKIDFNCITISIEKSDYEEGQMILDEIYNLYSYRVSFNHLIESLWLDFIECYKNGNKKNAYNSIIKLLKNCFK